MTTIYELIEVESGCRFIRLGWTLTREHALEFVERHRTNVPCDTILYIRNERTPSFEHSKI